MIIGLSVLVLVTCAYGICYSSALTRVRRAVSRCFRWASSTTSLTASESKKARPPGPEKNGTGDRKQQQRQLRDSRSPDGCDDDGDEDGPDDDGFVRDYGEEDTEAGAAGQQALSVPSFTFSTDIDTPDDTPKQKAAKLDDDDAIPQLVLSSPPVNKPMTPPNDYDSDDENYVPSFPALNSHQRASSSGSTPKPQPSNAPSLMLPPPVPSRNPNSQSRRPSASMLSSAASQRNPYSQAASSRNPGSLQTPPTITQKPKKPRKKIILEPGHSPLDWARLQRSGIDLRGISSPGPLRITPSELKRHSVSPHDVWMALEGKVYNVSAYLPFHPGGEKEVLRGAGKDATALFMKVHPWVNVSGMLDQCFIGYLVSEDDGLAAGGIDTEVEVRIEGSLEDID